MPRKSLLRAWLVTMTLLLPCSALAKPLLVVSLDGLGAMAAKDLIETRMPNLKSLISKDFPKYEMLSTFPTMTWAAHATMVTGVSPAVHGVIGNRWVDPKSAKPVESWAVANPIQVRTIWQAAADEKLSVAAIQWPSTSGVSPSIIRWNVPEVYEGAFAKDMSPDAVSELKELKYTADHVKQFADEEAFLLDNQSRDLAIRLWKTQQPDLMLLHFVAFDTLAHRYGPDHPATAVAAEYIDTMLGAVLKEARANAERRKMALDVMIVSDHGMLKIDRHIKTDELVKGAPKPVRVLHNGHCAFVYGLGAGDIAAYASWVSKRKDIDRVVNPKSDPGFRMPAGLKGDANRFPSLVVVAKPNTLFISPFAKTPSKGGHGFWPDEPALKSLLVLHGPSFRTPLSADGKAPVDMTSLAELMAKALQVKWTKP